jgi:dTDP-4-dehydrorhamnose reductase
MDKLRVLILGDGILGTEILRQTNWDYISRRKNNIDVLNFETLIPFMEDYDTIVNCIAFTKTYSEDRNSNWSINYKFVDELVEYCNTFGKKLIQISTDYIYTNSKSNASEEDVPVHLNTWYGYTKLLSDAHVQLKCFNYLICRLSHKPNPFPYDKAWEDIKTNCDYVDVIASLVIKLILKNEKGVYNVGTESKSIYDLAKRTSSVEPILRPSNAPSDTTMCLQKLEKIL